MCFSSIFSFIFSFYLHFDCFLKKLVGSSLLLIHDAESASFWMIDFAKTYELPAGMKITHNDEWKVGNHEDGYLIGIENLIRIFESLSSEEPISSPSSSCSASPSATM